MSAQPSEASAPTRGSRRRERTRQRLVAAAATLIAEKGVAGLRIQEITERADVALGSFYNHFDSKPELVEAVVAETINVRAQGIVSEMAGITDPAEAVCFATRRVIRIAYEDAELAWLFVNLHRADQLFEAMVTQAAVAALERGVHSGRFDIADPQMALSTMVGGALALMRGILDGRYGPDADQGFALYQLRGIGVPTRTARRLATLPLSSSTRLDAAA